MWYIDITNSIHNAETMMPDINMCVGGEWCVCVRERGEDGWMERVIVRATNMFPQCLINKSYTE